MIINNQKSKNKCTQEKFTDEFEQKSPGESLIVNMVEYLSV